MFIERTAPLAKVNVGLPPGLVGSTGTHPWPLMSSKRHALSLVLHIQRGRSLLGPTVCVESLYRTDSTVKRSSSSSASCFWTRGPSP